MHVKAELQNKSPAVVEQEIYFGNYPWMTDRATFIINGTERDRFSVDPFSWCLFTAEIQVGMKRHYGAKVIPGRGAWLKFETAPNGCIYVKIDCRRKIPVTTLPRSWRCEGC